jgi:hypothetical protein
MTVLSEGFLFDVTFYRNRGESASVFRENTVVLPRCFGLETPAE